MNLTPIANMLRQGRTVTFIAHGSSMEPKILSGQKVTVEPVDPASVRKGDVVLARVRGRYYLHLVKATKLDQVQIANNRGHVNGWTARAQVLGRLQT